MAREIDVRPTPDFPVEFPSLEALKARWPQASAWETQDPPTAWYKVEIDSPDEPLAVELNLSEEDFEDEFGDEQSCFFYVSHPIPTA
jgi:hypothetical protein